MQMLGATGKPFKQKDPEKTEEEEGRAFGLSKRLSSEGQMRLYSKHWLSCEGLGADLHKSRFS